VIERLSFISIHPEFIQNYFEFGVFASCLHQKKIHVDNVNLRDFAIDDRGTIDDRPFGGGDSMVLRPEPLRDALKKLGSEKRYVIAPSPRGIPFHQSLAQQIAEEQSHVVLVCPRFAGLDQRFIERYVNLEVSCGDFVMSGGEVPALMMADTILRLVPGALGNHRSVADDSFSSGKAFLLEEDLYTRPDTFEGMAVPSVLTSGDHLKIKKWREQNQKEVVEKRRPDLARSTKSN